MKKLIILFCGTLALAACGNGLEKKANEKLMVAKAAYERGDYEEAKFRYRLESGALPLTARSDSVFRKLGWQLS